MRIKLETISNVNDFVSLCSSYHNAEIDVKQGRQITDGKSILGVYSLNLLDPIYVSMYSDDPKSIRSFYDEISKWEI